VTCVEKLNVFRPMTGGLMRTIIATHENTYQYSKHRERAGILKAYKLGKLVRYRLSDILKLEAEAEVSL